MVKKPKVRQEFLDTIKDSIAFWDERIEIEKELLANSKKNKNLNIRTLKKLQKRYAKQ